MPPTGKNWLNFIYINIVFVGFIFSLYYFTSIQDIKDNWVNYRCNPMYMPLSDNIEQDFVKIPPMLLQPFVENAIKHGLKYTESSIIDPISGRRGLISIDFKEEGNVMVCSIMDNGIGRDKAEEHNNVSKEKYHTSTALVVIQERLELMKEEIDIQTLEIIDLYDENGVGIGTKVIVRIPI